MRDEFEETALKAAKEADLITIVNQLESAVSKLDVALHGDGPRPEPSTVGIDRPCRNRFEAARSIVISVIDKVNHITNEIKSI